MTLLQIMSAGDDRRVLLRTDDADRIAAELARRGVGLDRWTPERPVAPGDAEEEVLAAYRRDVDRVREAGGYGLVDVLRLRPADDDPAWPENARTARERFFAEHVHDEDEVRLVAEGRGCFYLRAGALVYAVVCEAGDLLSLPANTRHWFDMGARPAFTMIRFMAGDAWVGTYTGDPVAGRMPDLDEVLAGGPSGTAGTAQRPRR